MNPNYYYVDSANYELVILVQDFIDDLNGTGDGPMDETARMRFQIRFMATCETEFEEFYYHDTNHGFIHQFAPECDGPDPDTVSYTRTFRYWRETVEPIVNATILSPAALLYTPEAYWNIKVSGGANGPRTSFLYIDPDPIVTIAHVKRVSDGAIIPLTNGYYKLGSVRADMEEYEIKAYVKACEPGSVKAHVGWQCDTDDYPLDVADYLASSCEPFDLDLLYEPLPNTIQTDFVDSDAIDTVLLCEEIDYSVVIKSVSTAANFNLQAYLVIPGANSPYQLVDGEGTLTYPYAGGTPQTIDTSSATYGLSSSFPPFNGDAYYWDLNSVIDSLPGLGDAPFTPEEERTLRFDWKLNTTCEVTSATELWFYFVYTDACGNEKYTPNKFSKTIIIDGAVQDTILDWIIEMPTPDLNPCRDEHTYSVEVSNLSGYVSQGNDNLVFTLNENINFISASCPPTSDGCPININTPNIQITNPGGGQSGFQVITWEIPPGIAENESVIIDFVVDAEEDLPCGETLFSFGTEAEGEEVTCFDGSPAPPSCNIGVNTTNGRPIFTVDVIKPELSITATNVSSSVVSGIGESLVYDVTICNTGTPVHIGDTTRINFYYDADQSQTIDDATDVLIHTQFLTDTLGTGECIVFSDMFLLTAGLTCGILLEIDPDVCKCEGDDAPIELGDFPTTGTLLSEDFVMCSRDTKQILGDSLPGYTYTWIGNTTGLTNPNILNTSVNYNNGTTSPVTQQYVLEIKRGTGTSDCDALDTINVTILPPVDATAVTKNISCNSLTDGEIDLTPSGGQPSYTYNWSTGSTGEDLTGLPVGTYSVTITDDSLCNATKLYMISQPTTLSLGVGSSAAFCGQADGTASVYPSGGTTPYTYLWSNGGSTQTIANIVPGFYAVTVTDAGGCQNTASVTVDADGGPTIGTSFTNADCFSGNNGTANVVATPPSGTYSYSWSNGATTPSITGLTPGIYNITVTDSNTGCFSLGSVEIGLGEEMFLEETILQPACGGGAGGSVSVNITGGTPPFNYLWDDASASTTPGLSGITQGVYCVTVTDDDGCTENTCISVTEDCCDLDLNEITTGASCSGQSDGQIIMEVNTGVAPYTFQWSHNSALTDSIANNLAPGDYTITVSNSICSVVKTITIIGPEILNISITKNNISTCASGGCNGTVDLEVNGGTAPYGYFWTTGLSGSIASAGTPTTVITGLCLGTYDVTVTDANGCESIGQVIMGIDPAFSVSTGVTNADCGTDNGRIELNPIQGVAPFTYAWGGATSTTNVLDSVGVGTYTATITDAIGCTVEEIIFVNSDTSSGPQIITIVPTDTECGEINGSINLTVSAGQTPYTFNWSNGDTTEDVFGLTAGEYTVTITDANGCQSFAKTKIEEEQFEIDFTYTEPPCNSLAGIVVANGVGGTAPYSYSWDNGDTDEIIDNIRSGTYTVTVTDATGCTAVATAELNTTNGPQINDITITDVSCFGMNDGAIDLDISGGTPPYNILWDNFMTGASIGFLSPGIYKVTITDLNGCKAYGEYTIVQPDEILNFQINTVGYINCGGDDGGSIYLQHVTGTAPYTYLWNDGSNGCVAFAEALIEEEPPIVINNISLTDTICPNGMIDLDIEIMGGVMPYTYAWSNGPTTEDQLGLSTAGTYTVTVTDALSCTSTESFVIIQSSLAMAPIVAGAVCGLDNGSIVLYPSGGVSPYTFDWSHNTFLTVDNAINLPVGSYTVTITDALGCQIDSTQIPIYGQGQMDFLPLYNILLLLPMRPHLMQEIIQSPFKLRDVFLMILHLRSTSIPNQ